jgi:hypothetical protein
MKRRLSALRCAHHLDVMCVRSEQNVTRAADAEEWNSSVNEIG